MHAMQHTDPSRHGRSHEYGSHDLFEGLVRAVVGIKARQGTGSGVFIDAMGRIATNRHVIGTNRQVVVRLNSGVELTGTVSGSFADVDLAFVKVDLEQNPYARLLQGRQLQIGEPVYAVGHPFGLENTLTKGIVSAVERVIDGMKYVQTDAPINPGNSGGPLYSESGELVGINTMGISASMGLGFAVPFDVVAARYQELFAGRQGATEGQYCGVCGNLSRDEKYCDKCGAQLAPPGGHAATGGSAEPNRTTMIKCRVCEATIQPSERYCPRCGAKN
jgi:serine protease Do